MISLKKTETPKKILFDLKKIKTDHEQFKYVVAPFLDKRYLNKGHLKGL